MVAGMAIGSGPKIAHDAERMAKDAPMPIMKQFRILSAVAGTAVLADHRYRRGRGDCRQGKPERQPGLLTAEKIHREGRQHHQFAVHEVDHAHDAEQQQLRPAISM
jgi:hypothetical protein